MNNQPYLSAYSIIKSPSALMLFGHFIAQLKSIGPVTVHPHKTMISIVSTDKKVAYITQAGKNFIHIVFPFKRRHDDNLCFKRIQEVAGRHVIYHHFRMTHKEDVNKEVLGFMRIAMSEIID